MILQLINEKENFIPLKDLNRGPLEPKDSVLQTSYAVPSNEVKQDYLKMKRTESNHLFNKKNTLVVVAVVVVNYLFS